jgi:hypothetical protein
MTMPAKIPKLYPVNNETAVVKDISENYLTGYISLFRSIREHWIWDDPRKFQWWVDILMECNHADKKVTIGFELLDCKRGQTLHSLLEWSKRWRVDISTVRRFLKLLQSDSMIVTEPLSKTTRITVCKYDSYQQSRHDKDTMRTRHANAEQTQRNTNNNDNNYNNENKDSSESTETVVSVASNDKELKLEYKAIASDQKKVETFIRTKKPKFIEPYARLWNLMADAKGLTQVKTITDPRKQKIKTRASEEAFDFVSILEKARKSAFLSEGKSWFTFDWIIENQSNYIKVIEGNYDNKNGKSNHSPEKVLNEYEELQKRNANKYS